MASVKLLVSQVTIRKVKANISPTVTSWYIQHTRSRSTPNEPPFLIFVGCWTLLVLPYLFFNPSLSQTHHNKPSGRFFNKWAVLALDTVTCLFWFAGFVALAVYRHSLIICLGHTCSAMYGAIVVGVLAWIAFMATTVLAALHVVRTRSGGSTGQTHGRWIGKPTAQV